MLVSLSYSISVSSINPCDSTFSYISCLALFSAYTKLEACFDFNLRFNRQTQKMYESY